jgi:hypothetical protein
MKTFLLGNSLLLFLSFGYAQPGENNGQLNISIGPSFTVGQFANKNIYSEKAGLASVGGILNIGYLLPAKKRIGIVVSLHGQVNPIARRSLERTFSKVQFASFGVWTGPGIPTNPPPQPTTAYPNWKFKSASWKLGSLMAGGYHEFKTSKSNLALTSKVMIGFVYTVSPKVDGSSITDTSIVRVTQSSESAVGLSYLVHAGLKFKVNNNLNFITGIEYFGTNKMTFKDIVSRVTIYKYMNDPARKTVSQMTVTSNSKQSISSINLFGGISLQL